MVKNKTTELFTASTVGDLERVKAIVDVSPEEIHARGAKNRTPLHGAARGNHADVASFLISAGARMEDRTAFKMTALHVAVFYGSADVTKMLLEHEQGVAIDALDFGSWTALHYACNYNWGECAKLLIEHGADMNKKSAELQLVALHLAARSGNLATVELLLEKGCDVDQRNLFYTTPLHLACQNDRVDVVRYLLKAGATPDAPDEAGITPSQLTKRDDIADDLEEAVAAAEQKRDA